METMGRGRCRSRIPREGFDDDTGNAAIAHPCEGRRSSIPGPLPLTNSTSTVPHRASSMASTMRA